MTEIQRLNFGVEIETHVATGTIDIGSYHGWRGGFEYQTWLPAVEHESYSGFGTTKYWKAERDSSITKPLGRTDCEFVSPILHGDEGIANVVEAVEKIKEKGAKVNKSCGVHVTVTFPTDDAAALARLICLVARYERALFASTGTHSREAWDGYSRPIKKNARYVHETTKKKTEKAIEDAKQERYTMLNLGHLANGQNRVEFRLFSGSLNATKIAGWIKMCLALVEIATTSKRLTGWDIKGSWKPTADCGAGESDLVYLFGKIGWIVGKTDRRYGDVGQEIAPVKTLMKTLRRMAKQYDDAEDSE